MKEQLLAKSFITHLKNISYHLSNIRPTMAPLRNTVLSVSAKTIQHYFKYTNQHPNNVDLEDIIGQLEMNVEEMLGELDRCTTKIVHHFQEIVPENATLLTHSYR